MTTWRDVAEAAQEARAEFERMGRQVDGIEAGLASLRDDYEEARQAWIDARQELLDFVEKEYDL